MRVRRSDCHAPQLLYVCAASSRVSLCADPALSVSGWVSRVVRETAAGWPNVVRAVPLG